MAHREVITVGREHALIIESLNATKLLEEGRRVDAVERVVAAVDGFETDEVIAAAETVGARHTAAPLITAFGGGEPTEEPPAAYALWLTRGARNRGRDLALDIIRKAPTHIPRVVWQQLTLDPEIARFWALAHDVAYRNRWQILALRVCRALRR